MLALPHPFSIKTDKVCSYAFCLSVPSSKLGWCGVWGRATTHDKKRTKKMDEKVAELSGLQSSSCLQF